MDTENSAATENLAKTPDISESVQTVTPVIGRTMVQPQAPKDVLRPRNVVFAVVLLFVLGAATVTWGQLYHQLTAYNNPAATPVTQFTDDYDELLAWAEEYNDYESTPAPMGSLTTPTPVPYSPLPTNTYSGQQCIFDADPDQMKIDVDLIHDAISSLPLLAIQEDAQKDFNTNYYGFYWIGGSCFTPSYYCMVTYADHPEMLARYAYFNFHAPEKADNVSWDAYYDTHYPAEELRQMLIEQFEVDDVFLAAVDNYPHTGGNGLRPCD